MQVRWLIGGIGIVTTLGLTATLAGVGITNQSKLDEIEQKKLELSAKEGVYPPPESRVLRSPSSPAYPSPGYEN